MTTVNDVDAKIRRALILDDVGEPSPDPPGVGTRQPLIWLLIYSPPRITTSTVPLYTPAGRALVWPLVDPERHRISTVVDPTQSNSPQERLKANWEALGQPATVALGHGVAVALETAQVKILEELLDPERVWRSRQANLVTWKAQLHQVLEGVHAEMPPAARQLRADDDLAGIRARLAAAPGRIITARVALDRIEAHNLTRRLRRAGLGAAMRRVRNGSYTVLVGEL